MVIRTLTILLACSLLLTGGLQAQEQETTAPVDTSGSSEMSDTMKSVSGILAQRRSEAAAKPKVDGPPSFLTDIDRPEEPAAAGRMFQGLALCLGVFFIGSWIARRFGGGAKMVGERRIKILERAALTQKSAICLVEVDGRQVLLSTGSDPVQVLMQSEGASMTPTHQEEKGFDQSMEVLCAEELKLSA
jgi:flagellar biogenesis protein FliO